MSQPVTNWSHLSHILADPLCSTRIFKVCLTSPTDFGHLYYLGLIWISVSCLFIYLFISEPFILDAERAKISSTTGTTGTSTGTDTTGLTSDFANWSEWSGCSTTCSDGTRSRTRTCPGPYQCVGATTETETCSTQATCYSKYLFVFTV